MIKRAEPVAIESEVTRNEIVRLLALQQCGLRLVAHDVPYRGRTTAVCDRSDSNQL